MPPAMTGPTGRFPGGQLSPDDEGEIMVTIGRREGHVILDFGVDRSWVALSPQQALYLGVRLQQEAHEMKHTGRTQ